MSSNNAGAALALPLIPREILFSDPDKSRVRLSPDGKWLSYTAPVAGVANLHVAPRDASAEARPVTHEARRGIRRYEWASDSRHLIYLRDQGGNENFQAFSVDIETGEERNLTPEAGAQARLLALSPRHPHSVVLGLNDRDRRFHDPVLVDVRSGERVRLAVNDRGFVEYLFDLDLVPAHALELTAEGGLRIWALKQRPSPELVLTLEPEDVMASRPVAVAADGHTLYLLDSRGRDTAAVVAWTPGATPPRALAADERADFRDVLLHPEQHTPEAARLEHERPVWKVLDSAVEPDFQLLERRLGAPFDVVSRSSDRRYWLVVTETDVAPTQYFLYDRSQRDLRLLFTARPALAAYRQARMHPRRIRARDGLELVSYLSLPPGSEAADDAARPRAPLPLMVLVHGGPWERDSFKNHPWHQWLTNRGYAVLSVNFRGSLGFGKKFVNAGNGEWGGKMHEDLLDAALWAVDSGIARRDAIGIMGASFGGYATLVAMARNPDVFACGIDIVGPSNLLTFLANAPAYWAAALPQLYLRVGDPRTEAGRRLLEERSPLHAVEQMARPLLVVQGANDPRATQAESDQIVEALLRREVPVTYALYPDEGHGFGRAANSLSFHAIAEAFLSRHLGGRSEPIGDALQRSSVELRAGAQWLGNAVARAT